MKDAITPPARETFFFKLCHLMARFYPADFRREFESELLQVTQTALQHNSAASALRWKLNWLNDLAVSVLKERLNERKKTMNKKYLPAVFGLTLLLLWLVFVGFSFAKPLFSLPYPDPTLWLLGESPRQVAMQAINLFVLFTPLIAFLIAFLPYLKITRSGQEGQLAVIHILKAESLNRVAILSTFIFSFAWVCLFLFARLL